jgi:glycosyltransferase involved in cell wall biosynthesis
MKVIITSPSFDTNQNVSGISSLVQLIISSNLNCEYLHFELGKRDEENRKLLWFFRNIKAYLRWFHLMFAQKDALIHFNLPLGKLSVIRDTPLILIARIMNRRMIIHLHGGDFLMREKNPRWMQYFLRLNFSGKNPKVVLSSLEKEALIQKLKSDRIFVLPNCVALNEAREFNRSFGSDEILTLLFLGRISLSKGIEIILHAMESLKKRDLHFKFIMAGKGPDENVFIKKFSDLLGKDFEFKGVVSGKQKTKLLKECNVFLLPSFFEGLPMALLESMSFGLVPVVTSVGSVKNVVSDGKNGIIVSVYSSEEIVAAVEKLSQDKGYMQILSTNAQQYVFNNFGPEEYIARLNKIYNYE